MKIHIAPALLVYPLLLSIENVSAKLPGRIYPRVSLPLVHHRDLPPIAQISTNNHLIISGGSTGTVLTSSSEIDKGDEDKDENKNHGENEDTTPTNEVENSSDVQEEAPIATDVADTSIGHDDFSLKEDSHSDEVTLKEDSDPNEDSLKEDLDPNEVPSNEDPEVVEDIADEGPLTEETDAIETVVNEVSSNGESGTGKHDDVIAELKKKKGLFRRKKKLDSSGSASRIAKKLKNRNSLNIKRKVVHFVFGAGFAALNHSLPRKYFMPIMYSINACSIIVETCRYKKGFGWMNKAMHAVLGSSLRKHEMEGKFTGSLYYFTGVTTSAIFFPKTATTLGIFQLAIADPAASYFGRKTRNVYWSRIENGFFGIGRNKGLLGFAGGALACFPLNYRTLSLAKWGAEGAPGGQRAIILASLALGAAGSLADLAVPTPAVGLPSKCCGIPLPPLSVDDNFVVPIVSGFACMKIFNHLGWSQGLELSKYIIF